MNLLEELEKYSGNMHPLNDLLADHRGKLQSTLKHGTITEMKRRLLEQDQFLADLQFAVATYQLTVTPPSDLHPNIAYA